nr:MAG TPA: hypothetical protein [Caudoviricetes sp.]
MICLIVYVGRQKVFKATGAYPPVEQKSPVAFGRKY